METIAGRSRVHVLCVYSTSMYKCYGTSSMSNDHHVGTTSSVISMPTPKNSVGLREPLGIPTFWRSMTSRSWSRSSRFAGAASRDLYLNT